MLLSVPNSNVELDKSIALDKVNAVRQEGCSCGGKKMPPVGKVTWSETLYKSANAHAIDMLKNNYFSHYSKKGEDVGKRVDKFDYNWLVVGENIAEGQRNFDQALEDWLKSPSHCKMIMDGKVNEMGIAHAGKYWVQHFGKQKAKRN
ncbi:hypothetical protein GCM10007940_15020 [Portibacter lacus]|uniref:SCP domain-containing protein n=1 Tax=Portibacter lacus TaxID=1099794 RepID=A0AA37WEA0_9BACT|nr:hypothetical protein GCM10007940_15020 [Portibacter lacus]